MGPLGLITFLKNHKIEGYSESQCSKFKCNQVFFLMDEAPASDSSLYFNTVVFQPAKISLVPWFWKSFVYWIMLKPYCSIYNYCHGVFLMSLFAVCFSLDETWSSLFVISVIIALQCGVLCCPAKVVGTTVQVHNFCSPIHMYSKDNLH